MGTRSHDAADRPAQFRLPGLALAYVLLLSACGLTGCGVPTERTQDLVTSWLGAANTDEGAGALLTVAQVNVTILAFGLGLGLVTIQLASRHGVARVPLLSWDTVFFVAFALVGVTAPLLLSLRPDPRSAVVLVGISFGFVLATPVMVWRAVQSGLPPRRMERAVRRAEPRKFRRRSRHLELLTEGQETLRGIRDAEPQGEVRSDAQTYLSYLLRVALASDAHEHAASLVDVVLGPLDDQAAWRLERFADWIETRHNPGRLTALCGSTAAWDRAWTTVRQFAVDGPESLAARAVQVASLLAAGRVADCYDQASVVQARDGWGTRIAGVRVALSGEVSKVLDQASGLAVEVTERTGPERQPRVLFEATCTLWSEPAQDMRMGDDIAFDVPMTGLKYAYRRIVESLDAGSPELTATHRAEITDRIGRLAQVLLRLLEAAQGCGHLDSAEGRGILACYIDWVEDAFARGDEDLAFDLVQALQTATRSNFAPRNDPVRTRAGRRPARNGTIGTATAGRLAVTGLLAARADHLARTASRYHLFHSQSHSPRDVWLWLDILDWRHEKDAPEVGRIFLPALEGYFLTAFLGRDDQDEGRSGLDRATRFDSLLRNHDVLMPWLEGRLRPDVRLAVLLARWSGALHQDHRRPARDTRERREWLTETLAAASTPEERAQLKAHFARPVPPRSEESLLPYVVTRDLLTSMASLASTQETGAAADTYQSWRRAAATWLEATRGDETPEPSPQLNDLEFLATDPGRVARDMLRPHAVSQQFGHELRKDTWQTVFGYQTWNDQTIAGTRQHDFTRADLPERTYCLLPHWEGEDRGFVVAVEDDGSSRVLVLEGRPAEEIIPFTSRYLIDVVLTDCLGDLARCPACFGLLEGSQALSCPSCGGTGRVPCYEALRNAAWAFWSKLPASGTLPARSDPKVRTFPSYHRAEPDHLYDLGEHVRTFTSRALREHLAAILAGEPTATEATIGSVDDEEEKEEGRQP